MRTQSFSRLIQLSALMYLFAFISCNGGGSPPPPNNPCTGVTVSVTGTTTNPTTPTGTNGSIAASATGGSGFTYSLNGGSFQSSGTFSNLAAGTYSITAKNGSGCTGSNSFTLTAPNPCAGVTITVTGTTTNPTTPTGTNGTIIANASGGTAPYTYSIDGTNFQSSNVFNTLAVGNFTVSAKDANGCTGSGNFTLQNPCAGVTITANGTLTYPTTQGGTNGSIVASASGGVGPYTFSLNNGAFQSSGTFSNLAAGNYSVTAKDANGCTGTANFTLLSPCTGVTITVQQTTVVNPTTVGGSNGSITVTPVGGTAPFTYNINGGAFQSSSTFNNLMAGAYTIIAKDAIGCTGSTSVTLVNPNPCAGVTITQTINTTAHVLCTGTNNGSINSTSTTGGLPPYTFSLNGINFQSSGLFSNLAPGNYTVTAKDANNCVGTANTAVGTAAAGPLFTQVRDLLLTNCAISGCHNGTQPPNWTIDCNIVSNATLIQQRAVNGNPSVMPPTGLLPASERQKITNWINAGGQYSN
jgi:hypothetical protein